MRIKREKLEELLGVDLPENIIETINNLGFFGFEENDFINFEPASNRPDCNSIIGICCELASCINNNFSLSFHDESKIVVLEEERSNSPLKGWCVIKMDFSCIDVPMRETVKANGLKANNDIEVIAGWLTLMSGNPFIWIGDCSIDDLKIQYDEKKGCVVINTGSRFIDWGEKFADIGPCDGIFISVNIDAAVQKKYLEKHKMNVEMKNFYIRNGFSDFYIYTAHLLSQYVDFCYIWKRENKRKHFCVESSIISGLLGKEVSDQQINNCLMNLGYSKIHNKWLVPAFRNDILSIRDIAADIFRISRLLKGDSLTEERADNQSDIKRFIEMCRIRHVMLSYGFDEICTFPFVYKKAGNNEHTVFIMNPPNIYRNALPEVILDGMYEYLKKFRRDVQYFEIKKKFQKEWHCGKMQILETLSLSFGLKSQKEYTIFMAVLLELIPPFTTVNYCYNRNEWTIHLHKHVAIVKLCEDAKYISLVADIPLMSIPYGMNKKDNIRMENAKYGSIDLPITFLSTTFRDLVISAAEETALQCELAIQSWEFIVINGEKRWNCRYKLLFRNIKKIQYHSFNTILYSNVKRLTTPSQK